MNLTELKIGDTKKVINICASDKLNKRLLTLGLVSGTSLTLKRKAPFGDPLIITFRGFDIALRKQDAKHIILE